MHQTSYREIYHWLYAEGNYPAVKFSLTERLTFNNDVDNNSVDISQAFEALTPSIYSVGKLEKKKSKKKKRENWEKVSLY